MGVGSRKSSFWLLLNKSRKLMLEGKGFYGSISRGLWMCSSGRVKMIMWLFVSRSTCLTAAGNHSPFFLMLIIHFIFW